ncbi:hypothetical protein MBLNU230_g6277t1 [Neophaeotheca triangularis]
MPKGQRDEHREKVSPEGDGTSNSSRDDINNDPEHMANAHLPLPKTADEFEDLEVDEATERKILAKLDRRIIPMATKVWIYLMNMMDRVNIGNGRLFGLEEDLGMSDDGQDYRIAVAVLFITYCLFEAPSNMIIKRMQPARYLAGLVLAWGIVATFTAFVDSLGSMVACRLLLGLFEAGLFPGVILYLTMFYGKRRIAVRVAYFFATSAASGIAGGLVSYGISYIDGYAGWRAWRWIILINGIPTVVTGLIVPFVLPNSPESAKFLSEEDKRNMVKMRLKELGHAHNANNLVKADVIDGLKDWTTWAYAIIQYCINNMLYSFSVFLPTVINGMGTWTAAEVQAMTVPIYSAGAIVYVCNARLSDKVQRRGYFTIVSISVSIFGYCLLIANQGVAMSYAGCMFVAMGLYSAGGIQLAWLTVNNPRYGKRAIMSGLQLTIGNAAGVASPWMFEDVYAPTYYPGYGATIGLLALGLVGMITLEIHYKRENKKRDRGERDYFLEGMPEEQVMELGEKHPEYRFTT